VYVRDLESCSAVDNAISGTVDWRVRRQTDSAWSGACALQGALVNRGDSIKRRSGRRGQRQCGADDSPAMKSSSSSSYINDDHGDSGVAARPSRAERVVVLGDDEVGKTALLQQFMTSAYMAAAVHTHFGSTVRSRPTHADVD